MAINQILPFGSAAGANVLDPDDYAQLPARTAGFQSGVARSHEVNTALRQSAFVASMIGAFVAEHGQQDVLDDANVAALATKFYEAIGRVAEARANQPLVGSVAYFATDVPPAGWLEANGAVVSRTQYAALFARIGTRFGAGDGQSTFRLPELRGEFLRGWDHGRGVDAARALGSAQTDAQQAFTGAIGLRRLNDGNSLVGNSGMTGGFQFAAGARGPSPRLVSATDPSTLADDQVSFSNTAAGARTSTETRPRNVALLVCIKH